MSFRLEVERIACHTLERDLSMPCVSSEALDAVNMRPAFEESIHVVVNAEAVGVTDLTFGYAEDDDLAFRTAHSLTLYPPWSEVGHVDPDFSPPPEQGDLYYAAFGDASPELKFDRVEAAHPKARKFCGSAAVGSIVRALSRHWKAGFVSQEGQL